MYLKSSPTGDIAKTICIYDLTLYTKNEYGSVVIFLTRNSSDNPFTIYSISSFFNNPGISPEFIKLFTSSKNDS